ncbi:50S ribosomal protein L7/L12 [Camellia lanceoleosa]|nr:50S ribosomal protein L7/L12 [Camellia lanceoleosa]
MRGSRIISQSLSRHCTITSQNPIFLTKNSHFSISSTNFPINPYFARSRIQSDLTELLRKKLDINEIPVMAVMMPGMGFDMKGAAKGSGAAKEEEKKAEKTAFDLKLEGGYDAEAKIKIIKEDRACTDLGLKEAKDLVEKAPTLLKKGVTKEDAKKIIEKMKEVGAKVTKE